MAYVSKIKYTARNFSTLGAILSGAPQPSNHVKEENFYIANFKKLNLSAMEKSSHEFTGLYDVRTGTSGNSVTIDNYISEFSTYPNIFTEPVTVLAPVFDHTENQDFTLGITRNGALQEVEATRKVIQDGSSALIPATFGDIYAPFVDDDITYGSNHNYLPRGWTNHSASIIWGENAEFINGLTNLKEDSIDGWAGFQYASGPRYSNQIWRPLTDEEKDYPYLHELLVGNFSTEDSTSRSEYISTVKTPAGNIRVNQLYHGRTDIRFTPGYRKDSEALPFLGEYSYLYLGTIRQFIGVPKIRYPWGNIVNTSEVANDAWGGYIFYGFPSAGPDYSYNYPYYIDQSTCCFALDTEEKKVYVCGVFIGDLPGRPNSSVKSKPYSYTEDPYARHFVLELAYTSMDRDGNYVSIYTDEVYNDFINFFFNGEEPEDVDFGGADWEDKVDELEQEDDPYEDIYETDVEGGEDINLDADIDEVDDEPTIIDNYLVTNSRLYGAYVPIINTAGGILDFTDKYSGTLSTFFEHSTDVLVGGKAAECAERIVSNTKDLVILPFTLSSDYFSIQNFVIGNVAIMNDPSDWDEYVAKRNRAQMNMLNRKRIQFVYNVGYIRHKYDNFLDYEPYSIAKLFAPYVGEITIPLSTSYGKNISVKYNIDLTTGDIIVNVLADNLLIGKGKGNCAQHIQLNVTDNSAAIVQLSNRIAGLVSSAASGVLSGSVSGGTTGAIIGGVTSAATQLLPQKSMPSTTHQISNTSGNDGWLDIQDIILTVDRPIMALPQYFSELVGYKSQKTSQLGKLQGFNVIEDIHIRCSATEEEKKLLEEILKSGVEF